ncbi:DUF4905 domain-containing protein [Flammeovirga kamogawensis]|uniref:DUF4905 domain-containing protein n=1 Tax=Flammeovirga kamogawensis TaxID=373891 RepID=A0ABX8GTY7_9BACT|nr:DUF4905 domain-containing protein [Flammeovirga kamogawensis]MBB6459887.1 hypothetical protein [Flammeovirga kamogawensis]QWG07060.1 DUF4905 domain-containing protein [Flammeovirga kamogawensis]TRX68881.1 DUF4905 domain-containing protein [Flammeovirga kamogawensis]
MDKLQLNYSFKAHGLIWRVMYSASLKVILLEMRDGERKEVSFAALNVVSGKVLWEGLQLDDSWWVSMAGVKDGFLYFSRFDAESSIPKVSNLIKLDILEAAIIEDNQEDPIDLVSAENFTLPIVYSKEVSHNSTLTEFLGSKNYIVEEGDIHYLESNDKIIFVFLENSSGELRRKLLICNLSGDVIYEDTMDVAVKAQIMDSFFVVENMLLYIKDKEIWNAVPLA